MVREPFDSRNADPAVRRDRRSSNPECVCALNKTNLCLFALDHGKESAAGERFLMRINRSSSASLSVITRAVAVVICAGGFLASGSALTERAFSSPPAVAQAERILLPKLADTTDGLCVADCS